MGIPAIGHEREHDADCCHARRSREREQAQAPGNEREGKGVLARARYNHREERNREHQHGDRRNREPGQRRQPAAPGAGGAHQAPELGHGPLVEDQQGDQHGKREGHGLSRHVPQRADEPAQEAVAHPEHGAPGEGAQNELDEIGLACLGQCAPKAANKQHRQHGGAHAEVPGTPIRIAHAGALTVRADPGAQVRRALRWKSAARAPATRRARAPRGRPALRRSRRTIPPSPPGPARSARHRLPQHRA